MAFRRPDLPLDRTVRGSGGGGGQVPPGKIPLRCAVELEVFTTMVRNFKEHKKLLRDDAIALASAFDPFQIRSIFELLDEDCVTVLQSHLTKRLLIEVHSKVGCDKYYIPPGDSFCQCRAYQNPRVPKYYCKHVLAAHFYIHVVSSDEYQNIPESKMDSLIESISTDDPAGRTTDARRYGGGGF